MTFGIFSTSHWTAKLYRENKFALTSIAAFISIAMAALFYLTPVGQIEDWQKMLAFVSAVALGASLYGFSKLFAIEKEEERKVLDAFFKKLDTPIDVAKEVYAGGRKQVSTMPLVGRTVIFLGILVSMSFFTKLEGLEIYAVVAMVAILLGFGGTLWIMGKRTEWKEEQERIRLTQAT
jgi:UDP-N-acetylmuramyl pentapeptide phosphotransferase/UDP-N-acetylglucosamine-1-phosphate transferase